MTFGLWIKAARDRAGMTQAALSEAAHVHWVTLSKWENGHTVPQLRKLVPLFEALRCTDVERRAVVDALQGIGEFPS